MSDTAESRSQKIKQRNWAQHPFRFAPSGVTDPLRPIRPPQLAQSLQLRHTPLLCIHAYGILLLIPYLLSRPPCVRGTVVLYSRPWPSASTSGVPLLGWLLSTPSVWPPSPTWPMPCRHLGSRGSKRNMTETTRLGSSSQPARLPCPHVSDQDQSPTRVVPSGTLGRGHTLPYPTLSSVLTSSHHIPRCHRSPPSIRLGPVRANPTS